MAGRASPSNQSPRRGPSKATERKQAAFLAAYRETGIVKAAAEASGVSRNDHYYWLNNDPAYGEAAAASQDEAVEAMEREARRRAVEGWRKPVYYKGEVVGHEHRFSDVLLIFLLKAARPERYREQLEVVRSQVREREFGRVLQALEAAGVTADQLRVAREVLDSEDARRAAAAVAPAARGMTDGELLGAGGDN